LDPRIVEIDSGCKFQQFLVLELFLDEGTDFLFVGDSVEFANVVEVVLLCSAFGVGAALFGEAWLSFFLLEI